MGEGVKGRRLLLLLDNYHVVARVRPPDLVGPKENLDVASR